MSIKPADLIAKFQQAVLEKWGYIGGKAGVIWTEAAQQAAENAYRNGDEDYEMAAKYGRKWIGKKVADCSGMFSWAFKQLGGYMYHGQNTMWSKYTTAKGTLTNGKRDDGQPLKPGTAVFKLRNGTDYYHVGLYIGGGTVIEARGTIAGVTTSKVDVWHTWGELEGVDYADTSPSTLTQAQPVQTTTTTTSAPVSAPTTTGGGVAMNTTNAVVTATGGVNMRVSPSTNSVRLITIPQNTRIKAERHDDTWSTAEYNGKQGYVMTRYITFDEANSTGLTAAQLIANIERELAQLRSMLQRG